MVFELLWYSRNEEMGVEYRHKIMMWYFIHSLCFTKKHFSGKIAFQKLTVSIIFQHEICFGKIFDVYDGGIR